MNKPTLKSLIGKRVHFIGIGVAWREYHFRTESQSVVQMLRTHQ